MSSIDLDRRNLAQAIAGFRVQEQRSNRALIVADCQIRNLANRTHLHPTPATSIESRVQAATARVQAGLAAGTAQLGD